MEQFRFPVTKKEAERKGISYSSEINKNALFPSRLRALREEKRVSQAALASLLGVSKSTIGLYETGDTLPDIKTADDLANYFGVSVDYLIGRTSIRSVNPNKQGVCSYTGLSEVAIGWIEDMRADPHSEGLQALDRMLSTEQFRDIISYIVYISKFFDEMKHHAILNSLNEEEREILKKAQEIVLKNDEYEVYFVQLSEKVESSKLVLQNMFMDMVDDLFYAEKELGKFDLSTPTGSISTFVK